MKSLVYHGTGDVRIDDKPKPKIQDKEDVILKVTSTALCGSDLHLYHGLVPGMEPGQTLGHEFMGIIEETGQAVQEVKPGDRVIVPLISAVADAGFVIKAFGPNVIGQIQMER